MLSLEGAIDIHVHAAPELFNRVGDAVDIAAQAAEHGMAGLVFKAHNEPSMTRAYYAQKQVPGIDLYGGIVLNEFVGGINPSAVAAALHQGAKIVWGPTMHAREHVNELGKGTYGVGHMNLAPELASAGISVLDDEGRLRPEMQTILELAQGRNATVATGHLGEPDVRAIVAAGRETGTRVLLTHVFFFRKDAQFLKEMVGMGALLEVSASLSFPLEHYMLRGHGGGMRLETVRDLVAEVGAGSIVVSSDCGQIHNATPPEALRFFINALKAVGTEESDIVTMTRDTPRRILGLI
ncbi:MAG: hypothetical protein KF680_11470 [Cryobacterium sp.]|nr:hypothetical protein [Cryobacterium sp.]